MCVFYMDTVASSESSWVSLQTESPSRVRDVRENMLNGSVNKNAATAKINNNSDFGTE